MTLVTVLEVLGVLEVLVVDSGTLMALQLEKKKTHHYTLQLQDCKLGMETGSHVAFITDY